MTPPRVLVIGGGIGGLTAALALHRLGIPARVVERAPTLRPLGAGLTLQANAMAVLSALGVRFDAQTAQPLGLMEIRSGDRVLGATNMAALELPVQGVAVHRAALQQALLGALHEAGGTLEFGCEATALTAETNAVTVTFANGSTHTADLVVGADGLHSTTRRLLLGAPTLRYAGQTCWRLVASRPPGCWAGERWAGARRVGLIPLSQDRVYSFLVETAPAGTPGPGTRSAAHVQARFAGVDPVLDVILNELAEREAAGEPVAMHHDDLHDQPHLSFGQGRVVLLGDAAHAVTPNMGQGAGMAIEDAGALAVAVASGVPLPALAQQLHATRGRRVAHVGSMSWRIGAVAHWESGLGRWARDLALSLTPEPVTRSQVRDLVAPALPLADAIRTHTR